MQPHHFRISRILLLAFLTAQLISRTVGAQDVGPITREGLLLSLKSQSIQAKEYVERIKHDGVNFRLETYDEKQTSNEKQIRKAGAYLGPRGLDELIAAIRRSPYRIVLLLTDINPVPAEAASVNGRNYGLTETIQARLLATFIDSSDVVVARLSRALGNHQEAEQEGQSHRANYVLWGYLIPKKGSVRFHVFFTPVESTRELSSVKGQGEFEYPVSEVDERFSPNDEMANNVTYAMLVASGVARLEAGELDLALERLERATSLPVQPQMIKPPIASEYLFRAYLTRGRGRAGQYQWDSALSDLTKAIRLRPDSGEAYWQRGVFHYSNATKTNYSKVEDGNAAADLERATNLLPNDAGLYMGLGQAYLRMSNSDRKDDPAQSQSERGQAKAAFKKAILLAKANNPGLVAQLENKLKEVEK